MEHEATSRVAAARQLYNDAIDDGLAVSNPFAALQMIRSPGRRDIQAISHGEALFVLSGRRRSYPRFALAAVTTSSVMRSDAPLRVPPRGFVLTRVRPS